MKISQAALCAFNNRTEVTFNDVWNKQQGIGTKAQSDYLHKVGADKWGICRDGQSLTMADCLRYSGDLK